MRLKLYDRQGNSIIFCYVAEVDHARNIWTDIQSKLVIPNLSHFEVLGDDGLVVYEGNHRTD